MRCFQAIETLRDSIAVMRQYFLCLSFVLALTACSTVTPSSPDQVNSSLPAVASSAVARLDAMTILHTVQLPDGWKAIPGDCGQNLVCIFSKDVYTGSNEAIDHSTFTVEVIKPDSCEQEFAVKRAAIDGPDNPGSFQLGSKIVGFVWFGYGGAGVHAGDPYDTRFICVDHSQEGFDIIITNSSEDEKTMDYVDKQFIPFWLKQS